MNILQAKLYTISYKQTYLIRLIEELSDYQNGSSSWRNKKMYWKRKIRNYLVAINNKETYQIELMEQTK